MSDKEPSACNCELCQLARRVSSAQETRDFDALLSVCDELWGRMESAETECDVHEAVMAGQWPGSRRMLINALAKMAVNGTGGDE